MKRLLCIIGGMNTGGAETFLMKIYRQIDRTKYQMDFVVSIKEKGFYDDEILSLGGKIYHIASKSNGFIKNFNSIKSLVKTEHYQYVMRVSQHSLSALELFAAELGDAKIRIFRSSNSNTVTGVGLDRLLHKICFFMPRLFANVKIAPSTQAAEFMFGKNCIKKKKAFLLHNALDLNVYRYQSEARLKIRKEFGLNDEIIMGHIGRFMPQKNHLFLLDVFSGFHQRHPESRLLLIGGGELESTIRARVDALGLTDAVLFAGVRSDIPQLLSAMDVFVFPSLYEGMPNTVIEAQANGLPCLIADTITKEADITGLVRYLPLERTAEEWAEAAEAQMALGRRDTRQALIDAKYDIHEVVKEFISLIFQEET